MHETNVVSLGQRAQRKRFEPHRRFSEPPEPQPLMACFDYPGTQLGHADVLVSVRACAWVRVCVGRCVCVCVRVVYVCVRVCVSGFVSSM